MSMSLSVYSGVKLAVRTWRQHRETARIHSARRKTREAVTKNYVALCDIKCHALKSTGVFLTEHSNLEAAIVNLAYAMEDYRDPR